MKKLIILCGMVAALQTSFAKADELDDLAAHCHNHKIEPKRIDPNNPEKKEYPAEWEFCSDVQARHKKRLDDMKAARDAETLKAAKDLYSKIAK